MKKQFVLNVSESVVTATVRTCFAIPPKNLFIPKGIPEYHRQAYEPALHVDWKETSETGMKTGESVYFDWCMPETEEDLREMLTVEPGESCEAVLRTVEYPRTLVIEQQNWEETNWGERYDIAEVNWDKVENLDECRKFQYWFEDVFYPDLCEIETLKRLGRECFLPDEDKLVRFSLYDADYYGSPIYESRIDIEEWWLANIAKYIFNELDDEAQAVAIAGAIQADSDWDFDLLERLCKLADMEEEWKAAGDEFEAVVYKAADKLGVDLTDECY